MTTKQKLKVPRSEIARMLVECTGQHMCDSGGAYGRHWEKNRKCPPWERGMAAVEINKCKDGRLDILYRRNVYKWLIERLTFDKALQKRFDRFCKGREDDWLELMQEFTGEKPVNTYNGEDNLSQVLQFCATEDYCILQIHQGCDVRGGYTVPKCFRYSDGYECMFDNACGRLKCDNCKAEWFTDDNSNWYPEGEATERLDDYKSGRIVVTDGRLTCPECGEGHVQAAWA